MNKKTFDASVNFITQQYIEQVFSGIQVDDHPMTNELIESLKEPPLGAHLSTPRAVYTHHGLYIGGGQVVHYSGLADGLSAGPVEIVSLTEFQQSGGKQKGYEVIPHSNASFTPEQIIKKARKRLNEKNYNLLWRNCEHFVYDCIYGQNKSQQVNNVVKVGVKTLAKGMGKSNIATSIAISATELTGSFKKYINGDISGKRLIEEASDSAITTASASFYGVLGQAAIPIPVVGFLIGSSIGVLIGNLLLSSGHLSLGDSAAVKAAKERRRTIEEFSKKLKPQLKASRLQLEQYLETYFSERRDIISNSLLKIENSVTTADMNTFTSALSDLNNQFGCTLKIKSFEEFDQLMLNEDRLSF